MYYVPKVQSRFISCHYFTYMFFNKRSCHNLIPTNCLYHSSFFMPERIIQKEIHKLGGKATVNCCFFFFLISEGFRTRPATSCQCLHIPTPSPCFSFYRAPLDYWLYSPGEYKSMGQGLCFAHCCILISRHSACDKCLLSIYFRRTVQLNEPHQSPKIASYLPLIKETERGKRRDSNSRPPVS